MIDAQITGLRERKIFTDIKRYELSKERLKKVINIKEKIILAIEEHGEKDERKKS